MIENILQGITLRRYDTAFIEAWGMIPITYFGAVGDNRTDNYGNLQVAIDEAIKRKMRYLYVPKGTYLYSGNLLHLDQVIFMGNGTSRIYKKQGELMIDIPIHQLGVEMPFMNGTVNLTEDYDEQITEAGTIEIPVNIEDPAEAYIVVKPAGPAHTPITMEDLARLSGQVLHIEDGRTMWGNMIYRADYSIDTDEQGANRIPLTNKTVPNDSEILSYVYITRVELLPVKIKINYDVAGAGGAFNKKIEWSVR